MTNDRRCEVDVSSSLLGEGLRQIESSGYLWNQYVVGRVEGLTWHDYVGPVRELLLRLVDIADIASSQQSNGWVVDGDVRDIG